MTAIVFASTSAAAAVAEYAFECECAREQECEYERDCAFVQFYAFEDFRYNDTFIIEHCCDMMEDFLAKWGHLGGEVAQKCVELLSQAPAKFAEAERKEREYEEYAQRVLVPWLNDPANRSDECYSDIYKDVYGYRPRW